jgi:hypothetical protein
MVYTKCLFWSLVAFITVTMPWTAVAQVDLEELPAEVVVVSGADGEESIARPIVVASTDIMNAEIVMQTGREITIFFELYNKLGFQSGVIYGVELHRKTEAGYTLADVKVYSESPQSLGTDEMLPVALTYEAPAFLAGTYELWVVAKTQTGLPLSYAVAGSVALEGNGDQVSLSECVALVEGETYPLAAGVDVAADESLTVTCEALYSGSEPREFTPQFVSHERSVYGPVAETEASLRQAVRLEPGLSRNVSFTVPLATEAQAYDAVMQLVDAKTGSPVSAVVLIHYVIQGDSATIQNVIFDKASYASGEVASLIIAWSAAADAFVGARGEGSAVGPLTMHVVLADQTGAFCSAPTVVTLEAGSMVSRAEVPVTQSCVEPQVIVGLGTQSGLGLSAATYQYAPIPVAEELQAPTTPLTSVFVALALVALISVLGYGAVRLIPYVRGQRKAVVSVYEPTSRTHVTHGVTLSGLALLVVLSGGLFFGATVPAAEALTLYVPSGSDTITFSVNINKSTYETNEPVQVFGAAFVTGCGNAIQAGGLEARDGQGAMQSIGTFNMDPYSGSGFAMFDRTIAGYATPGSKLMPVRGYVVNAGITASALGEMPLTVTCPDGADWDGEQCVSGSPSPSATVVGAGCTIAVGESTCVATINWNIQHATNPLVRNVTTNTIYSYEPVGVNELRTITEGPNVVVAYDGSQSLATEPVVGQCADGSDWDGDSCELPSVPSATITATPCEIPVGSASCVTELNWNINAATDPNVYNATEGVYYSSSNEGNDVAKTITYGSHDILARNGASELASASANADCVDGSQWNDSICVASLPPDVPEDDDPLDTPTPANLIPNGISLSPSTVFNSVTGVYDALYVQYSVRNNGGTDTGNFTNRIWLDRDANGTFDESLDDAVSEGLDAGLNTPLSSQFLAANVPFGTHRVRIAVDHLDQVMESDETDNSAQFTITVLVPDPHLELVAEPRLVRSGERVRLRWDTNATFPMSCELRGPQVSHDFNPSVSGAVGTEFSGPLEAKAEFLLRCTEESTGTVFTAVASAEVVGRIEEI